LIDPLHVLSHFDSVRFQKAIAMQLSRYIDLASVAWTSSGPSVAEVDCGDCEGVLFIGVPGTTVARIPTLTISVGATTAAYVACSTGQATHETSASGNYIVVTDVYKPGKRYVMGSLASTAEAAHYLLAFKYGLRSCLASTVGFSSTHGYLSAVTGGIVRAISPTST
jgi:hypothetical protein